MKISIYTIILCFCGLSTLVFGQDQLIEKLDDRYSKYELISVDTDLLYGQMINKNTFHDLTLTIGELSFDLELWDSGLLSDNYKVTLASGAKHSGTRPLPMKGNIKGDPSSKVRLTFNEGFLYGFIQQNGKNLNIQPARYDDKSADRDLMVAYYDSNLKEHNHGTCATDHDHLNNLKNTIKGASSVEPNKSIGDCYEVLISLAADWLMFDLFGSVANTEDQVVGVLNDVESSYETSFADEIIYDLNEVFVSDCSTCDPWTSSTDAGDLLDDFTDWAPNNLANHEVATLWSDRNFNGSTIGLAWLGTACTNFGYNVCQNISGANVLRVLQSHELGHNFDSVHDGGGGFVMSPSVSGTTVWSAASEDDILNFFSNAFCFTSCGTGGSAPIADFDFEILSTCTPGEVEFFDQSTDATDWLWTFEGGFPETSTDENPVVFYDFPGTFDVTLEVSNAVGTDTKFEGNLIVIMETPIADFEYDLDELEITFENNSTGTDLFYIWEFGDGNFSTQLEPAHIYDAPGTYIVELDIENDCGFDILEETIEIFDEPNALFSSNSQSVCTNFSIDFTDMSYGNISSYLWTFPGGSPTTSTDQNPTVSYFTPGVFDVTLEVTNPEGQSIISEVSYVTVLDQPTAGFSYTANSTTISFDNTSLNSTSHTWDFGDGNTSTDENPTHTYTTPGFYTVSLSSGNICSSDAIEQTIAVYDQPNSVFSSTTQTGCANTTFQFNDMSYGNIVDYNWSFPGGTPATSTEVNPTVNYSATGVYDVTLQVTNPSGQSTTTETSYITITPVPTSSYTYTTANTSVTFTNTSSDATNYIWNFGDGNTSSDASPIHTYAAPGTYTVVLTCSNACGSTTETQNVTVNLAPGAQFGTVQSPSGCAPYSIDFIDTSTGNPTSWSWSFPGGNPATSNEQNPTVSYSTPGSHDVTLVVSNAEGSNQITNSGYVEILGPPIASYQSTVIGNRLELLNTTPGATAEWTISDGATYADNSVVHILDANGTYDVMLRVLGECGTDDVSFTISVDAYPTSSFTSVNTLNTDCAPAVIQFNSTSLLATNYSWQFPGGTPASSTEENPVITYNTSGTYDVSLEVSNQYGTDMSSQNGIVSVIDVPNAGFSSSANGPTISFSNTSSNGTSYSWDFGDGNTSNEENPSHVYSTPDTYIVNLIVTNECGSSEVNQAVIFDFALPIINAEFSATSGCTPFEVTITDQTTNNPTSWFWDMPGGSPATSTEQNPTVTYDQPGTYTISAEVSNDDGSSSVEFTDIVVVQDEPIADFAFESSEETISLENESIDADSYSWDFGDGQTSNDESPDHSYTVSGNYEIKLIASNECGSDTIIQLVSIIISSTSNVQIFGEWTLSPNPTDGEVSISFENALSESINYQIKDIVGRNVKEGVFTTGTQIETLSIDEGGVYLMVLRRGNSFDVKKLIVID